MLLANSKKILLCLLALFMLAVICLFLFGGPLLRMHWPGHFGNFNSITIKDNGVIDPKDLSITLITEYSDPTLIVDQGKPATMPEDYGPNRWCFNYRDSLYGNGGHWKLNNNHDHHYELSFFEADGELFCLMDIQGEDAEVDTVELVLDCTSRQCCSLD